MFRWIGRIALLAIMITSGAFYWKLQQIKQPIQPEEIPRWQVREIDRQQWEIYSVDEPSRKTTAWFKRNPRGLACDTSILLAGVKQGDNLLKGNEGLNDPGNTVIMEHPIQQYVAERRWEEYGVGEWWNLGELLRVEMTHTLGALQALLRHTHRGLDGDARFTENVVLAGGSFGAPFTAILTSFEPEQVSGLLLIYAFTDFRGLFEREFTRQGRIHFGLPPEPESVVDVLKDESLQLLSTSLSWVLSTLLKYGELEQYLPQVKETPMLFINGKNDYLVPRAAYDLMWNAAPEPKEEIWLPGDHINPGDPQQVVNVTRYMFEWGVRQGLRSCEALTQQ